MIPHLRVQFNRNFSPERYARLRQMLQSRCGVSIGFRVAETPIFVPAALLNQMAAAGAEMTLKLIGNQAYLAAARQAIPAGYLVAGQTAHPNFLSADFALVRDPLGELTPRLVEIQAFPSVFGYQTVLCDAFRQAFDLPPALGSFLGGLDEAAFWGMMRQTVLGGHAPQNVVLTELDPCHQKTRADLEVTARRLGIAVVDIRSLVPVNGKLHYRDPAGRLIPIHRIYNRAIADELMDRAVQLPFDLTRPWQVEWAGHPNWYFLISKFSLPWLSKPLDAHPAVPPAVFLREFLAGPGRAQLAAAGVPLPATQVPQAVYDQLVLKPLFSFAGKGIRFEPTQQQLEQIPPPRQAGFLLQQRMRFEPTIETPEGMTQAEIRILYLWPDHGLLTPALSLVRLGRGKMMGVDHNKNFEWVGSSAAFYPAQAGA